MLGKAARFFGIIFIAVGILGFIPQANPDGNLLGIFPMTTWHNVVHLLLGFWGLLAAGTAAGARGYLRGVAVIYALLVVLGLISSTQVLFGRIPLHGPVVWLHAALAALTGYFGFGPPSKAAA